jgi:uncharacterized protein YcfL
MMSKLTASILIVSLFTLACESTSNGYKPGPTGTLEESTWKARVNLTTSAAAGLAVREVRETRQNGLLRFQVDISNLLQAQTSYRTSVEWFDISGFKLDSPSAGWKSAIAQAQEQFTLNAGASNPAAVSWRLNVDSWKR